MNVNDIVYIVDETDGATYLGRVRALFETSRGDNVVACEMLRRKDNVAFGIFHAHEVTHIPATLHGMLSYIAAQPELSPSAIYNIVSLLRSSDTTEATP